MTLDALSHTKSGAAPYSGISPLPFWKAIFFFALPAIGFRLAIYAGMPALMSAGLTQFEAHVVSFTVPSAILLALALGFFQREGQPVTWATMRERFRLRRLTKHDWLWTIGGFLLAFLAGGMLTVAARQLIVAIPAIAPPDFFPPLLDPRVTLSTAVITDFVGAPLRGNWSVFILYAIVLCFNIFGEELWWRGLILPRQELRHGRSTWVIHGLMWLLWHVAFYPWAIISLLPICLTIPFISQRRQNNTAAIVIHWLYNGLPLIVILVMVLGLV